MQVPDSILQAPKLDLGRFWHDFFEILGQNAKKAKNAKNACQNKTAITNPPRVGGRRCSPPGGLQWNSSPGDSSFRKGRPQKYVRLKMCRPYFWWSKFRSTKKKMFALFPKKHVQNIFVAENNLWPTNFLAENCLSKTFSAEKLFRQNCCGQHLF